MTLNELRDWATTEFGAFSHKEGQVHAALAGLEEWLSHLARHGVALELVPAGGPKPQRDHGPAEPTEPLPPVVEVPVGALAQEPQLDPETFVHDDP